VARRLLLTYLTITALVLVSVVVPLGRIFADRERDQLTFDIERDTQAVASRVEDALEAGQPPSIDRTLTDYRKLGGRVVVVNRQGVSVVDSGDLGGASRDFSTRPEIATALDGRRATGTPRADTRGAEQVYLAVAGAAGGVVHGAVRITYPTSALDARVRAAWLRLGLLSAVVLGIVAAVGMVFARGVSRPVRRLQRAARQLADGDLDARVDTSGGPPELRALAETFNATAEQLGQLIASQRRFVADASHQLRTPLTALRLRLETLEPYVIDSARPKLTAAIAETHRLGRLVQSLLVLARTDAAPRACEAVDLSAAVRGRVDAWSPAAADQDVRLAAEYPPACWVTAVPGAVEQIVDNLVSNALDVASDGTTVTIRVEVQTEWVELHVIDEGPGMTAEMRARAFERFWRPARRPGDTGREGFGLGLAIVAQLASHCGGHARLDPGPGARGLDAVVAFPAVPVPDVGMGEPPNASPSTQNLYPTLTSG
jgi:signal transduction histidine kinase